MNLRAWILMDYEDYTLCSTKLFSTKIALTNYVQREYGELLGEPAFIDWKSGEVFDNKEAQKNHKDPVAVFKHEALRR